MRVMMTRVKLRWRSKLRITSADAQDVFARSRSVFLRLESEARFRAVEAARSDLKSPEKRQPESGEIQAAGSAQKKAALRSSPQKAHSTEKNLDEKNLNSRLRSSDRLIQAFISTIISSRLELSIRLAQLRRHDEGRRIPKAVQDIIASQPPPPQPRLLPHSA